MRVKMIPLKFMWWKKVLVLISNIINGSSKVTVVLKKGKNMISKLHVAEIVANLGTSKEIIES